MALLDTAMELLNGVGGTLGAGGGIFAAQVWRKVQDTHKAAKDAKKLANAFITAFDLRVDLSKAEPETIVRELALKLHQFVTHDELPALLPEMPTPPPTAEQVREQIQRELDRILRGSRPDFGAGDPVVLRRLDELERRMSAIEDDVDDAKREDRKWAEAMRETMGRIEGQMAALAGRRER